MRTLILFVLIFFQGDCGEIVNGFTPLVLHPPTVKLSKSVYPRQHVGTTRDPFLCLPDYRYVERTGPGYRSKSWKPVYFTKQQYTMYIKQQTTVCWLPVMTRRTE